MSFIKITSREQRDTLTKSLHDVKQIIKASQMKNRLEKLGVSRDLGRFFIVVEDLPPPLPAPALPPSPDFADPLPIFTSAAVKTLGKKTATAATNAAIKGVEKGTT